MIVDCVELTKLSRISWIQNWPFVRDCYRGLLLIKTFTLPNNQMSQYWILCTGSLGSYGELLRKGSINTKT